MKINEIITEAKTRPRKLKESTEVAELGRALMDIAVKQKDDEVSNNMSTLGDTLTRFGSRLGPQNIKDVVKQTGLQPDTIKQYMQLAQQHVEKYGPVRTGADNAANNDEKEGYVREEDESGAEEHRDTWKEINKYNKQSKQSKDPKEKARLSKKAADIRASLPPKERGPK